MKAQLEFHIFISVLVSMFDSLRPFLFYLPFSCCLSSLLIVIIGLFSSYSTLTITSSFRGIFNNIFICLIFSVSWEDFSKIYLTLSMIGTRLFWNIWELTDHFPLFGELVPEEIIWEGSLYSFPTLYLLEL